MKLSEKFEKKILRDYDLMSIYHADSIDLSIEDKEIRSIVQWYYDVTIENADYWIRLFRKDALKFSVGHIVRKLKEESCDHETIGLDVFINEMIGVFNDIEKKYSVNVNPTREKLKREAKEEEEEAKRFLDWQLGTLDKGL